MARERECPSILEFPRDGPLLVFGGPYGNLQATRALFDEARKRAIPPTHIICTGDLVAYGADPHDTVEAIIESGIHVVQGNCEKALARDKSDCGCGFPKGGVCDTLSKRWYAYARPRITQGMRAWMQALPKRLDLVINHFPGRTRIAVVHATPSSMNAFVYASDPTHKKHGEIRKSGCDGIIAGHSGIPFTQIIGGCLWHNAGVIGLPANDGKAHVWFSILRLDDEGSVIIEHQSLGYDAAAAAAAIRAADLDDAYADAMENGLWPGTDTLPLCERKKQGTPLFVPPTHWRPPSTSARPLWRWRRRRR